MTMAVDLGRKATKQTNTWMRGLQSECLGQSKKGGKEQELMQSSTTPDPGWESDKKTIKHHKQELRGQPFPNRWQQGSNEWKTQDINNTND